MKRQEHLAEVEEVAIRVRVENLKNGRYLGTSPDVPGLVAEGRSVAETVEIAQGLARKIVESCREHGDPLPPCVPEQGSIEARIPRSCFCLLNGTPRRIFLPGSCPPSQNVWFPIRPSRCREPRSLAPSPNGEKGHASAPFRRHGGGHATLQECDAGQDGLGNIPSHKVTNHEISVLTRAPAFRRRARFRRCRHTGARASEIPARPPATARD